MQARLLEDVRAHREVREPVAPGVGTVRADSSDLGGEVEHELRACVVEHPLGVVHRREVVVGAPRREDVVPVGLEPLDEVRAEKASAAGDERRASAQGTAAFGFRRRPYDGHVGSIANGLLCSWGSARLSRSSRFSSGSHRATLRGTTATRLRCHSTRTRCRPGFATRTAHASHCSSGRSTTTRAPSTRTCSPVSSSSPVPISRSRAGSPRRSFSRRCCCWACSRSGLRGAGSWR